MASQDVVLCMPLMRESHLPTPASHTVKTFAWFEQDKDPEGSIEGLCGVGPQTRRTTL